MTSSAAGADSTKMVTELVRLRQALQDVSLPLDLAGIDAARKTRTELMDQLEDYVIPRMMTIDAPLLAVVGGSTGAGKSTLVNSLVGARVTAPGLLRPTTRSPVLVHNPADAHWFGQDRLLPELARVDHATNDPNALQLVASESVPTGLAILDAPDVDSVEEQNRLLAAQLLAAADLWIFVTSAARYADQVPWEFLKAAAERSTAVAVVLDRTPADAVQTVATHLARMLAARGLKDSPLFIVHEGTVSEEGLVPASSVAEVRAWLDMLADDATARHAVVTQTLDGAVRALTFNVHPIADAAAAQSGALARLRSDAESVYDAALRAIMTATTDGTMMRGEVLARWQEFVGTGELLKSLEDKVGRIRDRMVNAVKGKPQQAERVSVAVESGLELLILEQAEAAAERAEAAWQQTEAGRGLLADAPSDLGRASRALRSKAERAVRDWQQDVVEMIRSEGGGKKATARFLAYGVNGLGVALMVVVFANTAGLTGAEVGIAGGTAVVGQKLLEAVFGDQAVRDLAARARSALEARVGALLAEERARFTGVLDVLAVDAEAGDRLRQAARRVDDVRYSAQRNPLG
ncbi:dynamin family protein [Nocardioides sp.]|jgi:predicted GTPase|uniref:dynamin family protein n=1 Tax=Nocardioides sp. TaxID=35761 RepID=UPI002BCF544D|nr:dynamin family protein [Nocardioides sp.]HVX54401.1 dynamin family protein [Nocardioides sp.]